MLLTEISFNISADGFAKEVDWTKDFTYLIRFPESTLERANDRICEVSYNSTFADFNIGICQHPLGKLKIRRQTF